MRVNWETYRRPCCVLAAVEDPLLTDPTINDWLTVDDACKEVGVSRRTIYCWIDAGYLTLKRTVSGRPRILRASLWRPA